MMITNCKERDYDGAMIDLGTANFVCGFYNEETIAVLSLLVNGE